ncbi:MAG: glycosyltransferase family 2 protein [Vicinamibacterales bacterium]
MGRPRLVAIVSAYNEEDIIGPALAHLVAQGASVYLLDDGSADRTVANAREAAGTGLIGVETLPPVAREDGTGAYCWSRILDRKAQLAHTLDGEWFIHQDADEFRESPWPHLSLADAVGLVDRLGWNAIDFEVFDFVPAGEDFLPGQDPVSTFRRYHPAGEYDRLQIRCWKKTADPVDLTTTGGHEARFPGRRVFPLRFPMRHYPIRSAAQGERKVFRDRKPRFDPKERARGWHVQYDRFVEGQPVVSDPASALHFDADAATAGLQIKNRLVEAACPSLPPGHPANLAAAVQQVEADIVRQAEYVSQLEMTLEQRRQDIAALDLRRDELERWLKNALDHVAALREEIALVNRNALDAARQRDEAYASRSWRLTRPLRAAWRMFGGK